KTDQITYVSNIFILKQLLENNYLSFDVIIIDEDSSLLDEMFSLLYMLISKQRKNNYQIIILTTVLKYGDIWNLVSNWQIINKHKEVVEPIFGSFRSILTNPNSYIYDIISKELNNSGIIYRPSFYELEETMKYLRNKLPDLQITISNKNYLLIAGRNKNIDFAIDDFQMRFPKNIFIDSICQGLFSISKKESIQRRLNINRYYVLLSKEQYDNIPERNYLLSMMPLQYVKNLFQVNRISSIFPERLVNNTLDKGFQKLFINLGELGFSIQNVNMIYLCLNKYKENNDNILLRSVLAFACIIQTEQNPYCRGFFMNDKTNLSNKDLKFTNEQINSEEFFSRFYEKFNGKDDIHVRVNIFWEMLVGMTISRGYDQGTRSNINNYVKEWCNNNLINYETVSKYFKLLQKLESLISSIDIPISDQDIPEMGISKPLFDNDLGRYNPEGGYSNYGNYVKEIFDEAYKDNKLILTNGIYRSSVDKDKIFKASSSDIEIIPAKIVENVDYMSAEII
ncbi:MAG: hypothetical protein ACYCST_21920, partial [Acidimicrobiales bacterium]